MWLEGWLKSTVAPVKSKWLFGISNNHLTWSYWKNNSNLVFNLLSLVQQPRKAMKIIKTKNSILFVVFASIFVFVASCNYNQRPKTVQELTIGIQNSPSNSLVIIAADKGFFDANKVKVTVKEFTAGKLALQALLGQANDIEIAVSAETPIVLSTLGGNKFKVISEIVKAKNECRVVVRKDEGLDTPETYFSKSRKLTTSEGGSPEWFTYNFINNFNIDKSKVEVIAMLPENMPIALSSKAVDAISIFDPFARIAEKNLGDMGMTFLNTNITSYYVMSVKEKTLSDKSEAVEELIKGLLKAEEFIKNNPEEAKQIVAAKTKLDIAILNSTWDNYTFALGLDSSLIDLCTNQSNWAIETGKYPKGTAVPDFKQVVSFDILRKVAPATVGL